MNNQGLFNNDIYPQFTGGMLLGPKDQYWLQLPRARFDPITPKIDMSGGNIFGLLNNDHLEPPKVNEIRLINK